MSVRHLLRDAIDDQLAINSALPRTLATLFRRPGLLTAEYFAGRIARYIAPVRLYLVASVLFFLALSLQSVFRPDALVESGNVEITGNEAGRPLDVRIAETGTFGIFTDTTTAPDTVVVWVNLGSDALNRLAETRVRGLAGESADQIGRAIAGAALERAPAGMFVLLPVFAGLLKLAYLGRRRFYVEHFVFALHAHAFAFLLLTVGIPFQGGPVDAVIVLWITVYCFLAMRRFYGGRVVGTLIRFMALMLGYVVILSVVMMGVLVAAILLG